MNRAEVDTLMRGLAPTLREIIDRLSQPIVLRLDALEQRLSALPEPVEPVDPLPALREAVSVELPDLVQQAVRTAVEAIPAAEPGKPGERGAPGKLGMVHAWEDRVFYVADVVTFEGATYQAQRDTGQRPPHSDWLCIVERGTPGESAISVEITGTYDRAREDYRALNVVALEGSSFIAKRDNPGPCPGDGWQLIASRGRRGLPGESLKGDPGRPGPAVRGLDIDSQGMLTLTNADGTTVQCDLYPLLAKVGAA